MRIGIIGQPCLDEIIAPDGSIRSRSLGGIFYSYAAMDRAMRETQPSDTFVPLTWRSEPDSEFLDPLLSKFQHMDRTMGLWPTDSLTNRVQLVYHDASSRTEHCPVILPRLELKQLSPELLGALDGLFVNMISGFDIAANVLSTALSATTKRPYVHVDIHALILGDLSASTDSDFGSGRRPRGVTNWREWITLADSIQLNELEARWLADPEIQSEELLLQQLLSGDFPRLQYVILTRAERGASIFDTKTRTRIDVYSPQVTPLHPTGSGDVFGSLFIYSLLRGGSPEGSVRTAVDWASWNTTLPSIESILTAPRAA